MNLLNSSDRCVLPVDDDDVNYPNSAETINKMVKNSGCLLSQVPIFIHIGTYFTSAQLRGRAYSCVDL